MAGFGGWRVCGGVWTNTPCAVWTGGGVREYSKTGHFPLRGLRVQRDNHQGLTRREALKDAAP